MVMRVMMQFGRKAAIKFDNDIVWSQIFICHPWYNITPHQYLQHPSQQTNKYTQIYSNFDIAFITSVATFTNMDWLKSQHG